MLLGHEGYIVDAAQDQDGYEALLLSDTTSYRHVILCHTVEENEQKACAYLARKRHAKVLALKATIPPDEF